MLPPPRGAAGWAAGAGQEAAVAGLAEVEQVEGHEEEDEEPVEPHKGQGQGVPGGDGHTGLRRGGHGPHLHP